MAKNPRVDAYIAAAEPFARPILKHLRKIIRKHCPRAEETLKWNVPHFIYEGKILFGMGAFKKHCLCGFWEGRKMSRLDGSKAKVGMGDSGRILSLQDLPSTAELAHYARQGIQFIEGQARIP